MEDVGNEVRKVKEAEEIQFCGILKILKALHANKPCDCRKRDLEFYNASNVFGN